VQMIKTLNGAQGPHFHTAKAREEKTNYKK